MMNIPSIVVAHQLRNAGNVLRAAADDPRLLEATARTMRAVAQTVTDTAILIEKLPPFVPDDRV